MMMLAHLMKYFGLSGIYCIICHILNNVQMIEILHITYFINVYDGL